MNMPYTNTSHFDGMAFSVLGEKQSFLKVLTLKSEILQNIF